MNQKQLLEELKLHLGLATYREIAETLGVSEITVSFWMTGRRQMRDTSKKLAESLIQTAKDKKSAEEAQKTLAEEGYKPYTPDSGESPVDQKELIATLRQTYGLTTHQEVADLLGVSRVAVIKWWTGGANMREATRRQIGLLLRLKDRFSQK